MRARLLPLLLLASTAHAGEFFETDGVAIGGYDAVAYMREQRAVTGTQEHTFTYKGSVFRFKSAENRDAFAAAPAQFAPQYGGYCAFGVSRGYKAVTSPESFSVVDGKLYLNYNAEVKTMWSKDVPGYISKADREWLIVAQTTKVLK
jgi:YHS domain-containing protein